MAKRLRFKQTESLADRLTTFAKLMRERAETIVTGTVCRIGKGGPG